jgi:hypothetical protein
VSIPRWCGGSHTSMSLTSSATDDNVSLHLNIHPDSVFGSAGPTRECNDRYHWLRVVQPNIDEPRRQGESLYREDDMSARPHVTSSFKDGGVTIELRVFANRGTDVQELLGLLFHEYIHVVGKIQAQWGYRETV